MINYNNIKKIDGWCSDEKIEKMIDLIIKTKPTNIAEIGVYYGKSLICQALALKENKCGKIYAIDSWNIKDCTEFIEEQSAIKWWNDIDLNLVYESFLNSIKENEVENYVEIFKYKSIDCIDMIDYIDILHIDGNHEENSSCRDVHLYLPKVKIGGYIWFDDAKWHQTQNAINLIETVYNCKLIDKAYWDDKINYCSLYQKQ